MLNLKSVQDFLVDIDQCIGKWSIGTSVQEGDLEPQVLESTAEDISSYENEGDCLYKQSIEGERELRMGL